MPEILMLRFRDLTANVRTIEAHREILSTHQSVLWGWWKKPGEASPDPGLTDFAKELRPGDERVILVDSGTRTLHWAVVEKVYYTPGGADIDAPDATLCPEYYRAKRLPAWFLLKRIRPAEAGWDELSRFVWSRSNRTSLTGSYKSLPPEAIGQSVLDGDFLNQDVSLWFVIPHDEVDIRSSPKSVLPKSKLVRRISGRYLIHLSDPHFGAQHTFRNPLAVGAEDRVGKETLLAALLRDLETLRVDKQIGLVVVSGDLTWSGDPHEFENGLSFLRQLSDHLGLHPSQLIVIPGNHDIEWREQGKDIDPNAELNFRNFLEKFYGMAPGRTFFRVHRFELDTGARLCLLGFNSCRLESKENAGLGYVGMEQLREAIEYERQVDAANSFKIAVTHHHLVPVNFVEDFPSEEKRISLTLDAEGVLRTLISLGVQLVLHGHQHQPFFAEERRVIQGYFNPLSGNETILDGRLAILGAGSIGVQRRHLNQVGRNSYNVVDLEHAPTSYKVQVRVQSSAGPGFVSYHEFVVSQGSS